ncbi:MAG: virulence factor SrfB [Sedimentisphaerales bacterium]|nr:virulence factor SrfB [Sedimentisphaerales bacterium]
MISLFIETGIQYVDLEEQLDIQTDPQANVPNPFNIAEDGTVTPLKTSSHPIDGNYDETAGDFGQMGGFLDENESADNAFDFQGPSSGQIHCSAFDALDVFSRRWIPIPYQSTHPFWVRLFLEPAMGQKTTVYRVVLACDTHTRTNQRNDELGLLRDREIGQSYNINPEIAHFWDHPEVQQLTYAAWQDWLARTQPQADPTNITALDLQSKPYAAVAKLWALVRYLAGKLPEIQISMGTENAPVDAHLVLDLGNCRTCGTIVETPGNNEGPFFAALEMRSRDLPCRKNTKPFETHMEFVRPRSAHGNININERFEGISLIRLGDDAIEAATDRPITGMLSGMSSPKRYLWDSGPRPTDWCFTDLDSRGTCQPIAGDVLRYIDPDQPFRKPEVALLASPPSPRYSRKTGLIFVLAEILDQAFAQMNSISHRSNMPIVGGQNRRRIFRSIVLVYPSGMTTLERKQLELGARRALDVWFDSYRDPIAFRSGDSDLHRSPPIQPKPTVQINCDESTAVQICYLYGEVQSRFQGDSDVFFATSGRPRNGVNTLRLASLDVGGGTTDLVISEYKTTPGATGFTCLDQTLLFRDGINLGGDDIAKTVLTEIVFPEIANQLNIPVKEWQRFFSQTMGAIDPAWESVRRHLVSQLWVPLARYYWGWTEHGQSEDYVTLSQIFQETHYPTELLKRFNEFLPKLTNGTPVDISTVQFSLSAERFNQIVRKVLSRPLYSFCDVIAQFDCDLMVVAGRAAGLPEIMTMLTEYCPLPPARIASLQGYTVEGNWFPFARDGVITDAKSCVVVGAAIHFLATTVGGNFCLHPQNKWDANTIIGIAQPLQQVIRENNVLFHPTRDKVVTDSIVFRGNLWLGCRNIDDERAYANALYEVCWVPAIQQMIRNGRITAPLAQITLAQDQNDPFKITVQSAQAQTGSNVPINRNHVAVKLHTIYSDDYWLDTGCFYD